MPYRCNFNPVSAVLIALLLGILVGIGIGVMIR